ncbi:MAG TPA: hypothetical protein VHA12_00380 [Candidatus Nanoarchaeia archaeon]|nr:hypothetical protein [Candidatus Nanoarchaeia archaeon]
MSLIDRLGNKSRIAIASLGIMSFAGCASNFEHFGEITPGSPADALRRLVTTPQGQGLIGAAVLRQQAQQQAAAGNVMQARRLEAGSEVVYANAQQEAAIAAARAGRSETNVYVNGGQQITTLQAINQARTVALASRGQDSYLVHMIPFDPDSAGIRIFRNAQRIDTGQGVRVYMEGENYTFDRGEVMQVVIHYPENRPGVKKYGVYCLSTQRAGEQYEVSNFQSVPLMFTRNIVPVDTSRLQGEYRILVAGGYSKEETTIEAIVNVTIR